MASADDPQLRNLIDSERSRQPQHMQAPAIATNTTIGVYAGQRAPDRRYEAEFTDSSERTTIPLHLGRGQTVEIASPTR